MSSKTGSAFNVKLPSLPILFLACISANLSFNTCPMNIGSIQLKGWIAQYVLFNTLFSAICKMYIIRFELNNKRQLHMCHLYSSGLVEVFATRIKIPLIPCESRPSKGNDIAIKDSFTD